MTEAELEKEAKQKSTEWFQTNVSHNTWETPYTERYIFELGYLAEAEPREKRIAELEKENAELHSKIGCYQKGMAMETNKRDIKITEAKEIINAFLDFESSAMERGCYIADDTRKRAEDFIKGVD